MSALKKYVRRTKEYPGFKRTDFKWSEANSEQFPRLAIRVRDELVAFGNPGELKVDEVICFDGRNAFEAKIESGQYDHLKDKPIVTYCTGGIVRYGKDRGDAGLWEGSLYTFDARMALDFTPDAKVIGECEKCEAPTKEFYNCHTPTCHQLVLLCDTCSLEDRNKTCFHAHIAQDYEMSQ